MKNKICIVGPCVNMGGIERASATIANYASNKGYHVMYLAIFKHPKFFNLNSNIVYDEPNDGHNVEKLNIVKTIVRIRKTVQRFNPDTILAFNKFYACLTLIALTGMKTKVFISERSSPLYKWNKKLEIINRLGLFLKKPAGIIAQTKLAAGYQQKYYGRNMPISVIPNALREIEQFPDEKKENWILAVGRLGDYLKGFDFLIEAFAKVKNKNWKLVFAGGDKEGQTLKELAKQLGVYERIIFLGKVKEIDKIYAQASIFVIPSRSEGFPNALCEAMGAGLPCISFDFVSGPRDIIADGVNGVIVENSNIILLAKKIEELIVDKNKRDFLGNNAININERLNKNKIGDRFLEFILN